MNTEVHLETQRVMGRLLAVFMLVLSGLVFLPGCVVNEYPEGLRYGYSPYTAKKDQAGEEYQKTEFVEDETTPLDAAIVARLVEGLEPIFGTPANPTVNISEELQNDPHLQLQPDQLKRGSSLYRQHCLYCHGLMGDASGPTGQWLNPRPRDFRKGKFKFKSTLQGAPHREDLKNTIRSGIPTANMPSFLTVFSEEDIEAVVSYVVHLALRGKVEYGAILPMQLEGEPDFETSAEQAASQWKAEAETRYEPPPPPGTWPNLPEKDMLSALEKGRELYLGVGACVQCHGKDGRSTALENPLNLGRRDDWGFLNPPRDLTLGAFRGGSRPIDLIYRMKLGIEGSGMPGTAAEFNDEDMWYLAYYVLSLSERR